MNLLDKILELKSYFGGNKHTDPQDISVIDSWMSKAKELFLKKSLLDHDGIKYVLEIFEGEVKSIDDRLLNEDSTKMPDKERDRLLDRRALAQKYLDLFLTLESDLETLEGQVDNELEHISNK